MTVDLSRRSAEAEWMDDPSTDWETFRGCLVDLARVNALSLGARPTLAFLERLRRRGALDLGRPVEILDVGSGYGDALRAIDRWAEAKGVPVRLTGLDLNPWSARAAAEATSPGRPIRWATGDVFDHEGSADLILSALFTHHLDDAALLRFLRLMEERAGIGWFVNDLHRHALAHAGFGPLATLLRMHPMVRHDGPASFRRAFRPSEWQALLRQAAIPEAQVRRAFPFRLCVARTKAA